MDFEKVEGLMRKLLLQIGVNPDQEGLIRNTPYRMAHTLDYLTSGYRTDIDALLSQAVFTQEINNMIICRDIELYSLCEHHMLPFFGRCHIGYIPKNYRILGISKLARLVDAYSRRLQIQERISEQVARKIMETIEPEGIGVVIEAQHLCMMMRGVEKQNSMLTSSTLLGSFYDSVATRDEFLTLIGRQHL